MNQLFAAYSRGKEAKELAVILGDAALSDEDKLYAKFAEAFEERVRVAGLRHQPLDRGDAGPGLGAAWRCCQGAELKRIRDDMLDKYMGPAEGDE